MTDPIPRATAGPLPTVYFISAGKSPRADLVPDMVESVGRPIDAREIGALDGCSDAEIAAMAPGPDEARIITAVRPGEWVVVAKALLADRLEAIINRLPVEDQPLVVVLSTGLMGDFETPFPTVNAQRALESAIWAMLSEGDDLGLVMPLEHQALRESVPALAEFDVRRTWAQTGDTAGLLRAVEDLRDCEIIVLNSVSYSEADRELVRNASGKRVVLARRIITSAVRLLLSTGEFDHKPDAEGTPQTERVMQVDLLTPRERQVLPLMAEGLSSKLIARQLGISPKTVEIHRTNILRKLDVRSSRELIYLIASQSIR